MQDLIAFGTLLTFGLILLAICCVLVLSMCGHIKAPMWCQIVLGDNGRRVQFARQNVLILVNCWLLHRFLMLILYGVGSQSRTNLKFPDVLAGTRNNRSRGCRINYKSNLIF